MFCAVSNGINVAFEPIFLKKLIYSGIIGLLVLIVVLSLLTSKCDSPCFSLGFLIVNLSESAKIVYQMLYQQSLEPWPVTLLAVNSLLHYHKHPYFILFNVFALSMAQTVFQIYYSPNKEGSLGFLSRFGSEICYGALVVAGTCVAIGIERARRQQKECGTDEAIMCYVKNNEVLGNAQFENLI